MPKMIRKMVDSFQLAILFLLAPLKASACQCPFSRLDNPGFMCETDVTPSSTKVDQLVEKIHANNPPSTCQITNIQCDENSPFRSITGYCNNLKNPTFGGSMSLFGRKLPNAYNDSLSQPRSLAEDGNLLPNPRLISTSVNYLVSVKEGTSKDHNHLLTIFGQWLGHDLVYTPIVPAKEECMDCNTKDGDCMPIPSIRKDKFFKSGCMQFTRSADGNTGTGERKQINQVSSYIDASNVYGSDTETYRSLREFSGGRMRTQSEGRLLPQEGGSARECSPLSSEPCFHAGDDRNGENMGLNAIHTLWVAEHNRIADYFAAHTQWNDTQIFLKTRQLITAMIQHIAYSEYLPILLGNPTMTKGFPMNYVTLKLLTWITRFANSPGGNF